MLKRADIWIAAVVIGLCGYAVAKQLTYRANEEIVPLKVGETLDLDLRLKDVSDVPQTVRVGDYTGRDFTVLYTWSTKCPCVGELEPRMRRAPRPLQREAERRGLDRHQRGAQRLART